MAVSLARRNGFARAFHGFHDIIAHFADECEIRNSATGEIKSILPANDAVAKAYVLKSKHAIMELMMAQFITRLIETRARGDDNEAVKQFAEATRTRYAEITQNRIGDGYSIHGAEKYLRIVHMFEQEMSNVVYQALQEEALSDQLKFDQGEEADFWIDVFLSLTLSRKRLHPIWALVVGEIIISRMDQFRAALAAGEE